jgi:O-acetyl-ADP-ribose deacetylase (regulator of RNase III)
MGIKLNTRDDYWEYPATVRINTVNCVGVMGAGIAKAFKERYPQMFTEYHRYCLSGQLKPGELHVWENGSECVVNLATKDHWQAPSQYDWIEKGLYALGTLLSEQKRLCRVALPALGCSNGGLQFPRVWSMICDELSEQTHDIMVFPPRAAWSVHRAAS